MTPSSEAGQTGIFECESSRLHFAQYSTTIYTCNSFDDSKCLFDVGNVHYRVIPNNSLFFYLARVIFHLSIGDFSSIAGADPKLALQTAGSVASRAFEGRS